MSNREDRFKKCDEYMRSKDCLLEIQSANYSALFMAGYQAATSASDARYQARVRELEEALRLIQDMVCDEPLIREIALKVELLSTPDTALQRKVLEARIDERTHHCELPNGLRGATRLDELRAQLASLNSNETLRE